MNKKQKKSLIKIVIAAVLTIGLKFVPLHNIIMFFLYLIPYVLVGGETIKKAWKGIKKNG